MVIVKREIPNKACAHDETVVADPVMKESSSTPQSKMPELGACPGRPLNMAICLKIIKLADIF